MMEYFVGQRNRLTDTFASELTKIVTNWLACLDPALAYKGAGISPLIDQDPI